MAADGLAPRRVEPSVATFKQCSVFLCISAKALLNFRDVVKIDYTKNAAFIFQQLNKEQVEGLDLAS